MRFEGLLVSPAAAALERTKTKHRFQLAELAPSTKSEKGRGKSSEQQKFDGKQGPTPEPDKGQSPAQSSEPDATKGGQSPVELAQPDKSVQPNQPANPGLLAALLLSGKDGKGHLVAIDTTKNFFAFDEIKKAWQPYQAVDISTLVDGALIGKDFSPPTFAVGYNLSTTNSTWLLLGWPITGPNSVKPFLRDSLNGTAPRFPRRTEAGQFNYAEWSLGEYEDLVIQQSSLPSFGLGSFTDFPNEQDTGKGGSTFYSVMFAPRVRGDWSIWAGSDRGLLEMHEADIALRPLPTAVPIRSIFFESPTQGWATSGWSDGNPEGTARPVVLETRDGGQNWQHVPYRWLPAPWVYVCFVLAVGAFWRGTTARAALSHKAPTLSIAEHGVSDNPIGLNDPDALGLVPIALAMSRFLRNVQTTPSLAIGVAGPWGSGKSSLMKLVREDLEDRGVRSVEFNAWHHQQEESSARGAADGRPRPGRSAVLDLVGLAGALEGRLVPHQVQSFWCRCRSGDCRFPWICHLAARPAIARLDQRHGGRGHRGEATERRLGRSWHFRIGHPSVERSLDGAPAAERDAGKVARDDIPEVQQQGHGAAAGFQVPLRT